MTDTVLRAIADDGSFRVIAALTTDTVRGVAKAQRVAGATASYLGDLLTGAILIRETMAPQMRVQGILKGAGKGRSFVADSLPDGTTRGLVSEGARASGLSLGEGAVLQMMRTMRNGAIQQGITEFQGGNISSALMEYLQSSEQITSVIAVTTLLDRDAILCAGGYVVQLLPEANPATLAAMTDRLARLPSIDSLLASGEGTPSTLVASLLAGSKYTLLEESPLSFGCQCSKERLLAALATIEPAELASMIAEGKDIETSCDYCNKAYLIHIDELRSLLN